MRVVFVLKNGCTMNFRAKRVDDPPDSPAIALYDDQNVRIITVERRDIQTLEITED